MSALVLDASAIVEMLVATEQGARVAARVSLSRRDLHVPDICSVEVLSAVRGLTLGGRISAARGTTAVADLVRLGARRHSSTRALARIWQLRDNLTSYDATYVVLAERLDATLITVDHELNTPEVRRLISIEVID